MNVARPPVTVMSSREFNQDTARAKRAAKHGPVFITDRGEPSHVLLTKEAYDRLETMGETEEPKSTSLRDALIDSDHGDDVELEIPSRKIEPIKELDL